MITLLIESALRSLALGIVVWLLMRLLRIRNPKIERDAWLAVLATALAMPWLMQIDALPSAPTPTLDWSQLAAAVTVSATTNVDRLGAILLGIYAVVVGVLLLRQAIALFRLWQLQRAATPVSVEGVDVRRSSAVPSPVNVFGSVIVPENFETFTPDQRRAMVAHEATHVANRDFYTRQLAQLHRNVFWFSPLAWWLSRRLSVLNEQISDDAALAVMSERTEYAELLLGFAGATMRNDDAVAMARPSTLVTRVERVLNEEPPPPQLGRRYATLAVLLPLIGLAGGLRATAATDEPKTPARAGSNASQPANAAAAQPRNVVLPKSNPTKPLSQPVYPPPSRRLLEQGTVVLRLYVNERGRVSDAVVHKSSGFTELDNAARYESFRWQLDPGTVSGTPTAMWGRFAVTFKLNPDEA